MDPAETPPAPPAAPPPAPAPLPAAAARPTNSLAVASLVAGIFGWFAPVLIGSLVAIVCGHLARSQIRASGEAGDGLAIAGLVLGWGYIVAMLLLVLVVVLFVGGLAALLAAIGLASA